MEKEFIPYEQSLALKELGFDEPCIKEFHKQNLLSNSTGEEITNTQLIELYGEQDVISAPTFSQAFRFFREKHNLHSEILLDQTSQPKYCFEIHKYEDFGNYGEIRIGEWYLYRTYEEAELACLNKLIEIVKEKK